MSEILAGDVAFLLYQLSVDDYFDDDTFDAVVNDDSGRCEINIQDLAESAARHIGKLEAENAALKEENEAFRQERKDLIGELHRFALTEQALKALVAGLEAKNQYLRKINSAMICDPRNIDTLLKEAIEYVHFKEPTNEG